jgi:hypothetical protein
LWFARPPRRCCPHTNQRGIYGDEINAVGGKRAECLDCGCLLTSLPPDGSARPSTSRRES